MSRHLALGVALLLGGGVSADAPKMVQLDIRLIADAKHDAKVIEEAGKLLKDFNGDAARGLPAPKGYAWLPIMEGHFKDLWPDRPPPDGFEVDNIIATYHAGKKHWMLTRIPTAETTITQADLAKVGDIELDKSGRLTVLLDLKPTGGERLGELTKTKDTYLAIIVNGQILMSPRVASQVKVRAALNLRNDKESKQYLEAIVTGLRAAIKKVDEKK